MIINPKKIIEMNAVKNVDPDALQPNSIDLTLHSAEHILDHGVLYKTAKRLPLTAKVRSDGRMLTFDSYQCYSVTFNEHVKVPENMVGFIVCRSSLNRMGAFITSGLYDSGFDNYIGAVLRTL